MDEQLLDALKRWARIQVDFDDFDGDRRGIGDALREAQQELLELVSALPEETHPAPQVAVPEGLIQQLRACQSWIGADREGVEDDEIDLFKWDSLQKYIDMLAAAPAAPAGEPAEIPEIGSQWRHRNGNVYTVEAIANGSTERPGQYPVTVVYRGENGKLWSRPAHDWHRSMTFESAAQQPVSDPDGLSDEPVPWPKKEDITEDMRAGFERLYRAKAERDGRTLERNDQGAYAHLTVDADWIFYQRAWADALEATAPDEREIAALEDIQYALDCFECAYAEGLCEALSGANAPRLRDLWDRRIAYAHNRLVEAAERLRAEKEGEPEKSCENGTIDPDNPPQRYDASAHRMTRCQADCDGDCTWEGCPQLRDGEPKKSGRHCPWDRQPDEEHRDD